MSIVTQADQDKALAELDRITNLPKRPVLDCEREKGSRRWAPAAQALVEVVTARYARGPRLSCGCQTRRIVAQPNGRVIVYRHGKIGQLPPLPLEFDTNAFLADNSQDPNVTKQVSGLRPGQEVTIEGFGKDFCITEFIPSQAWSLWETPKARGAFGMVSVGGGKSILGIMTPLTMPDLKTWVLMAKPDQRLHYLKHYKQLREHFRVPSMVFDTKEAQRDLYGIVPGAPVLHFMPYSVLSNPKSTTLLEEIDPDGLICDEFHLLSNSKSSRGMRFLRNMAKRNGRVCCGWTGTPIDKSLRNCAHLFAHTLGMGSPYPIGDKMTDQFAAVMDPINMPDTDSDLAEALRMTFSDKPSNDNHLIAVGLVSDDSVRTGFRERVIHTLGVISTKSSSITCSLTFRERKVVMPQPLKEPLAAARQGIRPDQEIIAEDAEAAKMVRSVSAGYHYYWAYPHSLPEHREPGGLIDQWFEARKNFHKELRQKLLMNEPHLDSKQLCENAAMRAWQEPRYEGDLPVWPAAHWPRWAELRDLVKPEAKTKWIDDFLAKDAAAWAQENVGIVWCRSRAFGQKVAELAGIPYCGGGPQAEAFILSNDGKRSIVASIKAHHEGRDGLQYRWHRQLLAEIQPSGKGMQQLLGRLAREGQREDEIITDVYTHVSEYRDDLRKALALAEFLESTTPDKQLILSADFAFTP